MNGELEGRGRGHTNERVRDPRKWSEMREVVGIRMDSQGEGRFLWVTRVNRGGLRPAAFVKGRGLQVALVGTPLLEIVHRI